MELRAKHDQEIPAINSLKTLCIENVPQSGIRVKGQKTFTVEYIKNVFDKERKNDAVEVLA